MILFFKEELPRLWDCEVEIFKLACLEFAVEGSEFLLGQVTAESVIHVGAALNSGLLQVTTLSR